MNIIPKHYLIIIVIRAAERADWAQGILSISSKFNCVVQLVCVKLCFFSIEYYLRVISYLIPPAITSYLDFMKTMEIIINLDI